MTAPATDLPADSLLLRYAADSRSMSTGPSVGLLQLMHPAIRTAVEQHSAFTGEPFQRVIRSIPQIWSTLLRPDGASRAVAVRDLHTGITGSLPDGSRYHALDPATFWWAHASFTWGIIRSVELFHRRQLSGPELEQLYQETCIWYRRYGMTERILPPTYAEFRVEFDRVCREDLEMPEELMSLVLDGTRGITKAAFDTLGVAGLAAGPLAPVVNLLVIGCLPDEVRDRWFASRWTPLRRRVFALVRFEAKLRSVLVPRFVDRFALRLFLRFVGAKTRRDRYVPTGGRHVTDT